MKLTWRKPLKFFSRSQGRVRFPTGVPHDESYLRLKIALFANTREISLERALLYTASHRNRRRTGGRAKATAYILEHVEISIRDEELIAGNRTVKPRAGIMSPEMDPYWLPKELDQFPTRPQDRFAISEEDKRIYREELFPYWEKRSMKDSSTGR
ncbi:pyruvate formate lyase family protein [Escherichia coli]